ncbi:lysophospholipid acyltransferase family protein [Mesorhizobium sp. IMUNJ 23033]|uniref:lysophospholipid acyltransferase family protein n=1 Tax=Mesorhizobium sp. IMUNJ 23033 TaxID=3378039 RepID=UPI00384FD5CA
MGPITRSVKVVAKLALFGVLTLVLIPVQGVMLAMRAEGAARWMSKCYHQFLALLLGIRLTTKGTPGQAPLVVLANHASWIDVIAIASIVPVAFVAKQEVGAWPIIGSLARLQRSVFVNRDRHITVQAARRDIASRIRAGYPVVIFPEGTSTDGTVVLPFRPALVESARDVLALNGAIEAVWVQPLAITYAGQGERVAVWERDDPTPFLLHLVRFLASQGVRVLVEWGDPIAFVRTSNRKIVCRTAEDATRRLLAGLRQEAAELR